MAKRPALKGDYKPIRRASKVPPWGYSIDPTDPQMLVPNIEMLHLLESAERAFRAKTSTHQAIAEWLTAKTGVYISRIGLRKRILTGNGILKARG